MKDILPPVSCIKRKTKVTFEIETISSRGTRPSLGELVEELVDKLTQPNLYEQINGWFISGVETKELEDADCLVN